MTDEYRSGPRAKVVQDSVSPVGVRLTTMEVTFHRFVLSEFNTHRVFSRNSASSRAIPIEKQLERVANDPAVPVEWGRNKRGMQADDVLTDEDTQVAINAWLEAKDSAVDVGMELMDLGVHKQVVNRILEPFMWHTVIVTATDWDGFWEQRISPLAQPEIRVAAEKMKEAYDASTPERVDWGEWHTPYIQDDENFDLDVRRKVSAARCARVSYLTHDGVRDHRRDLDLYERLVSARPLHASPLEHVAYPVLPAKKVGGNFHGWGQLRHNVEMGVA